MLRRLRAWPRCWTPGAASAPSVVVSRDLPFIVSVRNLHEDGAAWGPRYACVKRTVHFARAGGRSARSRMR